MGTNRIIRPSTFLALPEKKPLLRQFGVCIDQRAEWELLVRNEITGEIVIRDSLPNLITNLGRDHVITRTCGGTGTVTFPYMGVGSGVTVPDYPDVHLTSELIAAATRVALTNTSGGTLDIANIAADTSVSPYRRKIIGQGFYDAPNANDGSTFAEAAIFSVNTLPGSPTGTSGVMYNHFKFPNSFVKDANLSATLQMILRG
jgi:hypothetical protein